MLKNSKQMRHFFQFYIILLISCPAFAQKKTYETNTFRFLAKPDTIIRKTTEGYIYITTDTTSKIFDWIVPSPDDIYVRHIYNDYIEHIKKSYNQTINNYSIGAFPRAWNSVHIYKDKYFLYGPSDWLFNSGFYISDSIIYITNSDPSDLYVITEFQLLGNSSGQFNIINYTGERKTIKIEELNKSYGIYTWKIFDKDNKIESKYLMQNSVLSKKLPMIVNDCGKQKCFLEFDFEKTY